MTFVYLLMLNLLILLCSLLTCAVLHLFSESIYLSTVTYILNYRHCNLKVIKVNTNLCLECHHIKNTNKC